MNHTVTYAPPSEATHSDPEFARLRLAAARISLPGYAKMRKDELKNAIAAASRIDGEG